MNKLYNRVDWVDNTTPALNETNLNLMSKAIDDIDDRVVDIAGNVMTSIGQLEQDLAQVESDIAETQDLLESASDLKEDSEAWAVGQRDGVDVPDTDPAYENNSKYYSEQTASDKASTEAAKENAEAWADGQIDGVDVPSTHPAYHNNAKYWAENSSGRAISMMTDVELTSLADEDLLQYDGTSQKWENKSASDLVPTMTGATSGTAGTKGVVPAPSAGDEEKYLKGDGTWGTVTTADMTGATADDAGTHGLVPAPSAGDQSKVLFGDGTWGSVALPSDMTGATSGAAGAHGLVPAPSAGDQAKVLSGAGTWVEQSGGVAQAIIGGSYNASTAYEPGDRFSYNGVRYKVIIESGTVQGQTPPNANYYEECSVDDDIITLNNSLMGKTETVIFDSGDMTPSSWTLDSTNNRYSYTVAQTSANVTAMTNAKATYPKNQIYCKITMKTGAAINYHIIPVYLPEQFYSDSRWGQILESYILDNSCVAQFIFPLYSSSGATIYYRLEGTNKSIYANYTFRFQFIGLS